MPDHVDGGRGAATAPHAPIAGPVPLVLSAADDAALSRWAAAIAEQLADGHDPGSFGAALARAPVHHARRLALAGDDGAELADGLTAFAERGELVAGAYLGGPIAPPRVVFVYGGQGSQWVGMGRALLAEDEAFREAFLSFAGCVSACGGPDLVAALDVADASAWGGTWTVQPLIVAMQFALTAALRARGITPDAIVGHSLGETAALCAAGVYDMRSTARITALRAQTLRDVAVESRTCITDADESTLSRALQGVDGAFMSVHNGPRAWVFSGLREAMDAVEARLREAGAAVRALAIDLPLHTPLVSAPAEALRAMTADLPVHPPAVPTATVLTGTWQASFDATFWRDQMSQPARMAAAIETLLDDGLRIFVEIAPHSTLATYITAALARRGGGSVVPVMRRGRLGLQTLAEAVGALHVAGVAPRWAAYFPEGMPSAPLPPWPTSDSRRASTSVGLDWSDLPREARPATVKAALARMVSDLLGLESPPGDDTPLVNLGLDSMLALRLRAALERKGVSVSLGQLFGDISLADLARLVDAALDDAPSAPASVAAETPPDDPYAPFPLTDIQAAYFAGRSPEWPLGGVACHAAFAFEGPALDPLRLERAWLVVVDRHPALRTVLTGDGMQRVLAERPPWALTVHDLREAAADAIAAHRDATWARFGCRATDARRWPTFAIELTRLPRDRCLVHLDVDLISVDGAGLFLALQEWAALYRDEHARLPAASDAWRAAVVRDHLRRQSAPWRAHEAWWVETIEGLPPPPELPVARAPSGLSGMAFEHHTARLRGAQWSAFVERARSHGVSPSVALGAAFAEVIAAWSAQRPFTLTLTLFRPPAELLADARLIGEFTTTLLLEVTGAEQTFAERARGWRDRLAVGLEHIDCSGVAGSRAHARETGRARHFPVVFTSFVGQGRATLADSTAWLGEMTDMVTQTPQAWLDCQALPEGDGLRVNWDVPRGLYPRGLIEDAFGAWVGLLERLADDPSAWSTARFGLLPAAQRERRLAYDRTGPPAADGRLFDAFRQQVDAAPGRTAVIGPDATFDYATLDARANQIGHAIAAHGIAPGEPVIVCLPRGASQVAAVLGVHAAGGAYVPLDARWPAARRAGICASSGARVALTDGRVDDLPDGLIVIDVRETTGRPAARRAAPQSAADRAYIIHTSGSTGAPKGVVMSHRATLNTIVDINRRFAVGPDDRVLSVSSLAFDLSVYDIFGPLSVGGAVVMLEPSAAHDVHRWMALLDAHRVTLWNSVPALFELLVEAAERRDEAPGALRAVLLSGDWVPVDLPDRGRRLWPDARVDSLGGATEAAIWSIAHPTDALEDGAPSVPYGRPLTAQHVHVLDRFMAPAPEWVPGELYIGGAGLADGYWRDPERTAGRFVRHPESGARLYRTGDLGRFLPAGHIEFLGRSDSQVKIGGHRIELGEIEAALRALPAVRDAVVDAPGDRHRRRLVGYVVPDGSGEVDGPALEAALLQRLPGVMVPRRWVELAAIPLTGNGKVDRRALPSAPAEPAPRASTPTAQDRALERVLSTVAEVMPDLGVGPDDELVRAGANSVDLIRLGVRLNEVFGTRPPMAEILERGTPAALARFYEAQGVRSPDDALPLITDPAEREAHKARRLGLRAFADDRCSAFEPPTRPLAAYLDRASQRHYADQPIPRAALGRWLSALCPVELGGVVRQRHASAGGTYPLRTYLVIRSEAVTGQIGGAWYHDPVRHGLVPVGDGRRPTPQMHVPQNRPWVEAAPILLFFVAERQAIEPIYGPDWRRFALIEIGARCQLLEIEAARCGLGACQLGGFDKAGFAALLGLGPTEALLHGLAAGAPAFEEELI